MSDRELLELAAKAAGIKLRKQFVIKNKVAKTESGDLWGPLIDNGDALRLAVKLNLVIWECAQYNCSLVEIRYGDARGELTEPIIDNDPYAATRRAIVRAAAEIGKKLP